MKFSAATTTTLFVAINFFASSAIAAPTPTPDNKEVNQTIPFEPVDGGVAIFPWSCFLANATAAGKGKNTCPSELSYPCKDYCSKTKGACQRLQTGMAFMGLGSPVLGMFTQAFKTVRNSLKDGNPFAAMLFPITIPASFPIGALKGPFTVTRDAAKFIKICSVPAKQTPPVPVQPPKTPAEPPKTPAVTVPMSRLERIPGN